MRPSCRCWLGAMSPPAPPRSRSARIRIEPRGERMSCAISTTSCCASLPVSRAANRWAASRSSASCTCSNARITRTTSSGASRTSGASACSRNDFRIFSNRRRAGMNVGMRRRSIDSPSDAWRTASATTPTAVRRSTSDDTACSAGTHDVATSDAAASRARHVAARAPPDASGADSDRGDDSPPPPCSLRASPREPLRIATRLPGVVTSAVILPAACPSHHDGIRASPSNDTAWSGQC